MPHLGWSVLWGPHFLLFLGVVSPAEEGRTTEPILNVLLHCLCVVNRPGAGSARSPNLPRSKQLSPCEAATTERPQPSTTQEKILEVWITTKDVLVKCANALRSVLLMLCIKTASQLHKTGPSYTSDTKQHYVITLSSKAFIGLWHWYIKFYWGHPMILIAWSQADSHNSTHFKWLPLQNGLFFICLVFLWK